MRRSAAAPPRSTRSAPGSTSATATTSPSAPCRWSRSSTSPHTACATSTSTRCRCACRGRPDRPAVLFHDVERTLDALEVTHPDQVEGYRAYLRAALPLARLVLDLAARPPTPGRALGQVGPPPPAGRRTRWPAGRGGRWPRCCAATSPARRCSARRSPPGPAVWGVSPHLPGTGLGALRFALTHRRAAGPAGRRLRRPHRRRCVPASRRPGARCAAGGRWSACWSRATACAGVRLAGGDRGPGEHGRRGLRPPRRLPGVAERAAAGGARRAGRLLAGPARPRRLRVEGRRAGAIATRLRDLDDDLLRRLGVADPLVPTVRGRARPSTASPPPTGPPRRGGWPSDRSSWRTCRRWPTRRCSARTVRTSSRSRRCSPPTA